MILPPFTMVWLNCFQISVFDNHVRKSISLLHPATLMLIYVVGNIMDFIPTADAVIYPQNQPSTVQVWERLKSQPKKWYIPNGEDRNVSYSPNAIYWPEEKSESYRIEEQLNFWPNKAEGGKLILIWEEWGGGTNERDLRKGGCLVKNCHVTSNRSAAPFADAILFKYHFDMPTHKRPPNQVWILNVIETPLFSLDFEFSDIFNWTSTYRKDSDIPMPYDYWHYYDKNVKFAPVAPNIAAGKTKKVAWYVSNCNAASNRLEYAKELSKYIEVDIYGQCGTKTCDRSSTGHCLDMLKRDYKFYLSFENSVCKDYVTEKLFYPLKYNILPIAMGVTKEFYSTVAPENSFIHVDDFNSPKELAEYLHKLDKNDDLYNSYFQFQGTGSFLTEYGYYICRLCAILHSDLKPRVIPDINKWRNSPGECSFRPQGTGEPRQGLRW